MSEWGFTPEDQAWLAEIGVADAPVVSLASSWVAQRVLRAAAAGVLIGPDLDALPCLDMEQVHLPVRLGDRPASGKEVEAANDLVELGLLVWVGCRITATAAGRQRLAEWAQSRSQRGRRKRDQQRGGGDAS